MFAAASLDNILKPKEGVRVVVWLLLIFLFDGRNVIVKEGSVVVYIGSLPHAFSTCFCISKEITLVGPNQRNYFKNANACRIRTLKTRVATRLKGIKQVCALHWWDNRHGFLRNALHRKHLDCIEIEPGNMAENNTGSKVENHCDLYFERVLMIRLNSFEDMLNKSSRKRQRKDKFGVDWQSCHQSFCPNVYQPYSFLGRP